MRSLLFGIAFTASMVGVPAVHAADTAAGKEKAELCVGCHGENGISQMENIPSLAGQPDQFIQWQLVYFRAGARKNEQMQPIVEQITNEDIRKSRCLFCLTHSAQDREGG
jgi:cytochrome c553